MVVTFFHIDARIQKRAKLLRDKSRDPVIQSHDKAESSHGEAATAEQGKLVAD